MGALETIHGDFNPRPPRGGRQDFTAYHLANFDISIHALREEGDGQAQTANNLQSDFNPRPPRGGRLNTEL